MIRPRTLKPNEIDVRVQSTQNGKANMLLYIDSRAATDLLDETYGMENWTMEYKDVCGQIYGRLSVWDEEHKRWIYREDTGSESNVEAEKGQASDIIKRCLVRFGVTELYSAPKITWDDDGYKNVGYKVSEISYDENRNITHLVIVNRFNREAFRWDATAPTSTTYQPTPISVPTGLKTGNTGTFDHTSVWDAYVKRKVEQEGYDRERAKAIYRKGKEEAANSRYKDFWPSSLFKRLEQVA